MLPAIAATDCIDYCDCCDRLLVLVLTTRQNNYQLNLCAPRLCGRVAEAGTKLNEAEELMLQMYADRAGVPELEKSSSCRILDMGCGWGR